MNGGFCKTSLGVLRAWFAILNNTVRAEELVKLEGVGEVIAARIIEYREKNGPFETPEDVMKVKGMGEKTFEKNKDRIVVEDPS